MRIVFVAGFAPIVRDIPASKAFYRDTLGISFEGGEDGEYIYTEKLGGAKHLGLWPLKHAAQACFGADDWPSAIPEPQASIEFELESPEAVAAAADELVAKGHRLIHGSRTEPWNQTIARLMSPEDLLVGVCCTPWHH